MNTSFRQLMDQAASLTRAGNLSAATAVIQQALGAERTLADATEPPTSSAPMASTAAIEMPPPRRAAAQFTHGVHQEAGLRCDYKLFMPPREDEKPLPLVVMLHGCTQTPDDFAAGTRMNDAALAQGFAVLYPAQSQKMNAQRCWNWFKHSHQARGRGEPALLAGLTRSVISAHGIDPTRVYVAGLSAGGAMAAILGEAYPELFVAIGVHSGLAVGAASDLPSALAAMKSGAKAIRSVSSGVPTIVFHGDADTTVHQANAHHVIAACAGAANVTEHHEPPVGNARETTRRVHTAPDGRVAAEHWIIHGAAHAWSGGSGGGSYTDPRGPDATAEMLRFFFEHTK